VRGANDRLRCVVCHTLSDRSLSLATYARGRLWARADSRSCRSAKFDLERQVPDTLQTSARGPANVGNGRRPGIAVPAGFNVKQPFRRPLWIEGDHQKSTESRHRGLQIARRKPVIRCSSEREIGTEPPAAAHGRQGEVANGRFREFRFAETGIGRTSAKGIAGRPERIESRLRSSDPAAPGRDRQRQQMAA
jgi:hypothetical protein